MYLIESLTKILMFPLVVDPPVTNPSIPLSILIIILQSKPSAPSPYLEIPPVG
jgi:hypothetical protein